MKPVRFLSEAELEADRALDWHEGHSASAEVRFDDAWFRARVEESLADDSPGVPHEQVMREMDEIIEAARAL